MNETQYLKLILSQGCIVTGETGAHVIPHHIMAIRDGKKKVSHFLAIPLVSHLHTSYDDSIHQNKARFEMLHGREVDLLAKTVQRAMTFHEVPF